MPKIIIHSPAGTFDAQARKDLAGEITHFALECEDLPKSPFVKSTVWIYFNEYAPDCVFMGESPAYKRIITVQFYVIEGGLGEAEKEILIRGITEILGNHTRTGGPVPAYIVIRDVPESNWGIFGKTANLAALRASAADAAAL
jgi:phenylpyruvate tautomerase PptA (4-oxalocrotonate tautomerase family)